MPYLLICEDSEQAPELRQTHMQAHLDYITASMDKLCVAGPCSSKGTNEFDGSCLIYQTDDLNEAQQLFFGDPYYKNGVYKEYSFRRFVAAAGEWIGGATW